jgi:hypothetical protein
VDVVVEDSVVEGSVVDDSVVEDSVVDIVLEDSMVEGSVADDSVDVVVKDSVMEDSVVEDGVVAVLCPMARMVSDFPRMLVFSSSSFTSFSFFPFDAESSSEWVGLTEAKQEHAEVAFLSCLQCLKGETSLATESAAISVLQKLVATLGLAWRSSRHTFHAHSLGLGLSRSSSRVTSSLRLLVNVASTPLSYKAATTRAESFILMLDGHAELSFVGVWVRFVDRGLPTQDSSAASLVFILVQTGRNILSREITTSKIPASAPLLDPASLMSVEVGLR